MSYLEEKKQEAIQLIGFYVGCAFLTFSFAFICCPCFTFIAVAGGFVCLIFGVVVFISQKEYLTYSAEKEKEEVETNYYECKFKQACQKSTESVEKFDDMMKEEDKLKFIRWVIDSKSFKVWHFNEEDGEIFLQPKSGVGNCVVFRYKSITYTGEVNVQLWRDLMVNYYDFGTMYEGEGFVDNFFISREKVEAEFKQLLKMVEDQNAEDEARRRASRLKAGNGKNFINMMSEF